ncbi:1-(5-phosphoribosyl)-5-[(5-phosphoribosylamino)methylideneamino]imidazole-4-carboxamide isomerase [Flavobacterium psychrotrophum]|uniref:1-(5-phosphoribosyl)-5-[(5- phosphoribosylamino)methylideneamino]imidazole-4- carboxamide isomerase n=1 Tax=Flavobacterium psychrotrophum TaxID=2294119 RepID=UPI000E324041|nr:1-(5-phosphoribosyl)-5-[(5-phosphoribosylamino)methylideneamino]imidazole-4-carboxamide isomerase [Flavobacterium psychrotrophum]
MKIIPAIDIINGQCVRLTQGDYAQQKTYNSDPLAVARTFEDAGLKYLHLVDLDGAKGGRIINQKVLEAIATKTSLIVDFGGGIKTDADIALAFDCGAQQVTVGSIAVKNAEKVGQWLEKYGPEKIILGADCKDRKIAVSGWQEESKRDVIEFIKDYNAKGIIDVVCTDISKDGMLAGPSFELYKEIIAKAAVNLIASGGVTTIDDIVALKAMGCTGAIIGKAIYEGTITLKQLKDLC